MMNTQPLSRLGFVLLLVFVFQACQNKSKTDTAEQVTQDQQSPLATKVDSTVATAAVPAVSGPESDGTADVYSLGWIRNGKVIVYRSFFLSYAISTHSVFGLVAVDIVSDSVVWSNNTGWDEGNVGGEEDDTPSSPRTGEEAWQRLPSEVLGKVQSFQIEGSMDPAMHEKYSPFPLETDDDYYTAEVVKSSDERSYEIIITSRARGSKKVYSREFEEYEQVEPSAVGYFINPQRDRIAVIVSEMNFSMSYPTYFVTGCHLRSGFQAGK